MYEGAVSTAEQRDEIIESCNEIEEWLYDEGRDAEVSVYKSKQAAIKVKAEAIFKVRKQTSAAAAWPVMRNMSAPDCSRRLCDDF